MWKDCWIRCWISSSPPRWDAAPAAGGRLVESGRALGWRRFEAESATAKRCSPPGCAPGPCRHREDPLLNLEPIQPRWRILRQLAGFPNTNCC